MKRVLLAAGAALALSACAEGYYGPYGGGGVAYYDDFYGPYYDGYWGPDSFFYYRGDRHHPYNRDEGRHFRHDPGGGFHDVRPHAGLHGFPHADRPHEGARHDRGPHGAGGGDHDRH